MFKLRNLKINLLLFCVPLFQLVACSKNQSNNTPDNHYGEIFQIRFTMDNNVIERVYSKDSINTNFGQIWGMPNDIFYYGGGPFYDLGNDKKIGFMLASTHGPVLTDWDATFATFVSLYSLGDKPYGPIMHAPPEQPNRVEVRYEDQNGEIWSSTRVDASIPISPVIAPDPIQQNGSTFTITSVRLVSTNNKKNNAVVVKGTFNCTLYKYSTFEQKKITNATFVGVYGQI